MNKIFVSCIVFLAGINSAGAWTFYQKNQSPSYFQNQAVTTVQQQMYSNQNNLNPYSTFQSPYNNQSVRNNFNQYGQPVKTYNGVSQGQISSQVPDTKSVTNPFGQHGSNYSSQSTAVPYDQQRWNNPYSQFQASYSNDSLRNSNKYGVQYKDSAGQNVGNKNINGVNSKSVNGGYEQSPYDDHSVQNPYGGNKVFN